ncbi:alginate export [Leptospira inadai serovar Lyme str. 10]|uniref:Alginate export n=2 Tax=Leptospira inadai serovar Lyme TaxID=293084 RepID=V6HTL4_9LEPT|nr:alginate export family protein [Leptospira inadai]EQA36044.1 alginate export [Leptospira inadai serovar Lyme str. 10]PNV76824.1 hypothetical protein BES34_000615 [Leptospira inadai serovar Lyme]
MLCRKLKKIEIVFAHYLIVLLTILPNLLGAEESIQGVPASETKEGGPRKNDSEAGPIFESTTTVPTKEAVSGPVLTSDPIPVQEAPYKSPMVGKMSGEYLRSLQLTPEQNKAVRSNKDLWFQEKYRVGFALRPRYESQFNPDFDKTTPDNRNVFTNQTQAYLVGDINKNLIFKITLEDIRQWGGSQFPSGTGDGRFGLAGNAGVTYNTSTQKTVPVSNPTSFREAFLDVRSSDESFRLRIGRQIAEFGDGRIIGARNFNQIGNSFDGLRFTAKRGIQSLDVFGFVISSQNNASGLVTANGAANNSVGDAYFVGTNYWIKFANWIGGDFYDFTLLKRAIVSPTAPVYDSELRSRQSDQLNTYGFRLTNRTQNNFLPDGLKWDWTVEAAWQSGSTGQKVGTSWLQSPGTTSINVNGQAIQNENQKYDAHFLALQTGYSPVNPLRVGIQYVYASGDPNRNDSSVSTWNPLFGARRAAGGSIPWSGANLSGVVFWQNVKDYSINIKYDFGKLGTFTFVSHFYYKAKLQDGYYNNNGYVSGSTEDMANQNANNAGATRLGKKIASEIDLIYQLTPYENLSVWTGIAFLRAGDAITNAKVNLLNPNPALQYTNQPNSTYFFLQTVFAI